MKWYSHAALVLLCTIVQGSIALTTNPTQTVSGVPHRTSGSTPNAIARIEFTTVTVDNLTLSADFYGGVMGGFEIDFCQEWDGVDPIATGSCTEDGAVRYYGDVHQLATFSLDMNQENTRTPDISDNGDYEILSRY